MKTKGKGDVKGQRKRRKARLKGQKRTINQYCSIDGNPTWFPVAYCEFYDGVLTQGQLDCHRCRERECIRLKEGVVFE